MITSNAFMNLTNLELDELMIEAYEDLLYIKENPKLFGSEDHEEANKKYINYQNLHFEKFGYYHTPINRHVM